MRPRTPLDHPRNKMRLEIDHDGQRFKRGVRYCYEMRVVDARDREAGFVAIRRRLDNQITVDIYDRTGDLLAACVLATGTWAQRSA